MSLDPEDIPYVPSVQEKDKQDFDYAKHQAMWAQKATGIFEAQQAEAVEAYEAKVEGRPIARKPSEEEQPLIINGIAIPPVTPAEPEYLLERVPVDDASSPGLINMPHNSSKMYKQMKRPNPNYVSREYRNSLILDAQNAMAQVGPELRMDTASGDGMVITGEKNLTPANIMSRMTIIQNLLEDENIIGFEMRDGHLIITLE